MRGRNVLVRAVLLAAAFLPVGTGQADVGSLNLSVRTCNGDAECVTVSAGAEGICRFPGNCEVAIHCEAVADSVPNLTYTYPPVAARIPDTGCVLQQATSAAGPWADRLPASGRALGEPAVATANEGSVFLLNGLYFQVCVAGEGWFADGDSHRNPLSGNRCGTAVESPFVPTT